VVGVDAFGQVPQPLAAFPPGDRDLAARDHEVEQLGDVLVVGPAGGGPRPVARVGHLAGWAAGAQPAEDVAAAPVACTQSRRYICQPFSSPVPGQAAIRAR
jgi:hypothetical protein